MSKKNTDIEKREIKNAVIRDLLVGYTDQNIFTAWLVVALGQASQGYGGYNLTKDNTAHVFIAGVLNLVGAKDIKQLQGKAIRIEHDSTKIYRIGHFLEDKWFDYESELTKEKEAVEDVRQPASATKN